MALPLIANTDLLSLSTVALLCISSRGTSSRADTTEVEEEVSSTIPPPLPQLRTAYRLGLC